MNRLKIKWTDLFSKAVREFVKWGDLVNHSGAEIKLKTFKLDMAPETKRIYSFTDEQIYFSKQKQKKLNYLKLSRFER